MERRRGRKRTINTTHKKTKKEKQQEPETEKEKKEKEKEQEDETQQPKSTLESNYRGVWPSGVQRRSDGAVINGVGSIHRPEGIRI